MPPSVVRERKLIGVKIFNQVVDTVRLATRFEIGLRQFRRLSVPERSGTNAPSPNSPLSRWVRSAAFRNNALGVRRPARRD